MQSKGAPARPIRVQEHLVSTQYYAPRGKERLLQLGEQIGQTQLSFTDRLVGFIGDSGSGKSSLIRGIFPGLELANDDDVLSPGKIMEIRDLNNLRVASTYHLDMRFQTAFTQMFEIVEFVQKVLAAGKRVVVEHFNLLAPALGRNADLLIAIGEEIIVTRPTIFGPQPESLYQMVHESLHYRKMAHSAEEVTSQALYEMYGITDHDFYSADIRNGYVLKFNQKPDIDLDLLEKRILEMIREDIRIDYHDEHHITFGDAVVACAGPRIHMRSTGQITNFILHKELVYDARYQAYCLIGLVGDSPNEKYDLANRNTEYFLRRK